MEVLSRRATPGRLRGVTEGGRRTTGPVGGEGRDVEPTLLLDYIRAPRLGTPIDLLVCLAFSTDVIFPNRREC